MLTTAVAAFLAIQGLAVLLMIGACAVAAASDRRAVRPYVPQAYAVLPAEPGLASDFRPGQARQIA